MCQKLRKRKISFNLLSSGSPRIISLSLVLLLGLSPLAALPWRAVNKMDLKDQVESRSDLMEISPTNSLQNSSEVNNQLSSPTQQEKNLLKTVDGLLESTSTNLTQTDFDIKEQIYLTTVLAKDNMQLTEDYAAKADEYNKVLKQKQDLEKKLYSPKVLTEVLGTYNLETGFGVGASIGVKAGHGAIIKAGATVPLQTIMNPPQLSNLNNYTFQASMGWEW